MPYFPTEDTYESACPICPNCGYEFDTSEGDYYPRQGLEETFEGEECPACGMKLTINVSLNPYWSITHPQQCNVRGYHYVYEQSGVKRCLECSEVLTCNCGVGSHCPHVEPFIKETV